MQCGYFSGKCVPSGCRGVLSYAARLAVALHDRHYPEVTNWKPECGNLTGLLLQIDNMTAGLIRQPIGTESRAKAEADAPTDGLVPAEDPSTSIEARGHSASRASGGAGTPAPDFNSTEGGA